MRRNLSSRLLIAFAFVILLSLGLSGAGTLFLLRDQQRDAAEERVGRLAEPLTLAVALLEQRGVDPAEIQAVLRGYAASFDVRALLVNEEGRVVFDTESRLTGHMVDDFRHLDVEVTRRGSAEFRTVSYDAGGEELILFAPAQESLHLSTNRLLELTAVIYSADTSIIPRAVLEEQVSALLAETEVERIVPAPAERPLVVVPAAQIAAAWWDVFPQLAIAGGIALLASVLVAVVIARSISRPLARITQAAQEMARGHYEQELDLRGDDEVGRLAQAFNDMTRQVSRSHRMMRDLLANVSHELKTPLTSIQGFSQAMEEGAISSLDEYKEAGRIINEETQRMRRLIEDLIDLSRLESGHASMQEGPVDLSRLLRTCAQRFDWQLRESRATLKLDLPALPPMRGDERRLEQAFTNLIDNAVRHTPEDGTITVRAEAANGLVRVAVRNTGSFVPSEELPRLFERFYQVDRQRSRSSGGAGLGLAIASEVIHAHDGEIQATSDEQTGTEFVVLLPVSGAARATDGA
ncbi:MAG: HAMP domain-containing protein [Chloroflexi bacterium]|nr:HAMP domain-containing protein [Chloroflexota bacterium]